MWISTVFIRKIVHTKAQSTNKRHKEELDFCSFGFTFAVVALARFDQRDIDRLVREDRTFSGVLGNRRLQKILVVTIGKLGFVMRAARLIAIQRAERDHAREQIGR